MVGNCHVALPHTPVVKNPLLLIVQNTVTAASREQVQENTTALTGITLATMPETKLLYLRGNDQRAANIPALDIIISLWVYMYGGLCTGARMGHTYEQVQVDLRVCVRS